MTTATADPASVGHPEATPVELSPAAKQANALPLSREQQAQNAKPAPQRIAPPRTVPRTVQPVEVLTAKQALENWATTGIKTKGDWLDLIEWHKVQILQLNINVPSTLKLFFLYRVQPGNQQIVVYAKDRNQADQRLRERMTGYGEEREWGNKYSNGWSMSPHVVLIDASSAASTTAGSFLTVLGEYAQEFVDDWERDQTGREPAANMTQVAQAVAAWHRGH